MCLQSKCLSGVAFDMSSQSGFSSRAVIVLSMRWWDLSMEGSSWTDPTGIKPSGTLLMKADSTTVTICLQIKDTVKETQVTKISGGLTFCNTWLTTRRKSLNTNMKNPSSESCNGQSPSSVFKSGRNIEDVINEINKPALLWCFSRNYWICQQEPAKAGHVCAIRRVSDSWSHTLFLATSPSSIICNLDISRILPKNH